MLTCIACSKQQTARSLRDPPVEDDTAVTLSSKQPIKALTNQIKDMAVKASGAYKSCNPCSRSSSNNQGRAYPDSEAGWVSERFYGTYKRTRSLNNHPRLWGKEMEAKLKALSGEATPSSVSGRSVSVVFMEEDEPKEWVAQVEPGVLITFVSLPQGGNGLKRIQFSREMFNKWQAQRWWADNYDKVMELYNVQGFNRQAVPETTLPKPEEEQNSKIESAGHSPVEHHQMQSYHYRDSGDLNTTPKLSSRGAAKTDDASSIDASAHSISSRESDHSGEISVSNASDLDTEWVEQDEPGVYITIGTLPGGTRELRRVRFSREKFGEMQARLWWEENRARIQQQYL